MTISCQLKKLHGQPIEGVFVELKCMDFPEQRFSGLSDKSGMIDEWMSVCDQKVQYVQCTPNMEGSHLQMRFHAQPTFGETFPETWNTIWVPQKENSHVVLQVDGGMCAVIKNGASHGEIPRTGSRNPMFSFGPSIPKNNPSSPHQVMFGFGTSVPYDQIARFKEPADESDVTGEAPTQEPTERQTDMPQSQELRRSARLAKP